MRVGKKALILSVVAAGCVNAAVVLSQGFDDVTSLASAGWVIQNRSNPAGASSWFQGNTAAFNSQSGAANSYIAANFNATGFGGNVSDWLFTPTISLDNTEVLTFYTRSSGAAADRLEVRLSLNGTSTNVGATDTTVGDFSILLLSVNPTLSVSGYPNAWSLETVSLASYSGLSSGRIAFRYYVSDTSSNGDYIGLDSLSLTSNLPEPGSGTLLASGLLTMLLCKYTLGRKRACSRRVNQQERI